MLTSSTGANYGLNEHEDDNQYGSLAIPSDILPYQSYPESLMDQNEIAIELSSWRAHLALIMSLMSIKMLTNMIHMQYHPR